MIEERGANLSGGQRQRIAIARALATNPRILILDEATSALDYDSERIIQENMRAIVRGRTVIIIAHRLAAVRPCSRIVGMQRGEIVEVGSHEELLRREGGLYAHLWDLQSDQARAPAPDNERVCRYRSGGRRHYSAFRAGTPTKGRGSLRHDGAADCGESGTRCCRRAWRAAPQGRTLRGRLKVVRASISLLRHPGLARAGENVLAVGDHDRNVRLI